MADVVVIGGGIGGLTAAVALQRQGFAAHVYEAASELRPVGAGITVPPNAMSVLSDLELGALVAAKGIPLETMEIHNLSGEVLQTIDGREVAVSHGHALTGIRRSDLQEILADALAEGSIHLGKRFVRFEQDDQSVRAEFGDGSSAVGAVLVGADGLRSAVRAQLRPHVQLRYSGQTCLRGLAPIGLPPGLGRTAREIWGGASRFGFLEVAAESVYWYAPYDAPAGSDATGPDMKDRLLERYRAFPEVVREVIAATPAGAIVQTDLSDLPPLRGWSEGRVTLLGDAAHPMTPNLGQGGAQAIEDALALARRLREAGPDPTALAAYERARSPRTRKLVTLSWRLGKAAHWENPVLRRIRDGLLRAVPAGVQKRQTDGLLTRRV